MMTFGIGTLSGCHVGFLLMAVEDAADEHGSLMVKVQVADEESAHLPEVQALAEVSQQYFVWRRVGEGVRIEDERGEETAHMQGEYLQFRGYTYCLSDLSGVW